MCCRFFLFYQEDKTISKEALINDQIRAKEVRLIDADGNQIGIVSIKEAMAAAQEAGLDLINISPNAAPPVCRIADYGKYRYNQQKREKEAKKKQSTMEVKEMRLGIFTEDHDLETKAKLVSKFLEGGDKVKVSSRRGELVTTARVGKKVSPGESFMTFHFPDGNANILTNAVYDDIACIPEYKVCAVKIEKA